MTDLRIHEDWKSTATLDLVTKLVTLRYEERTSRVSVILDPKRTQVDTVTDSSILIRSTGKATTLSTVPIQSGTMEEIILTANRILDEQKALARAANTVKDGARERLMKQLNNPARRQAIRARQG